MSAAAQQAADGSHHLVGLRVALGARGAHDAVVRVVVEQAEGDLVEGSLRRRDLREDVDAVAVLVNHVLDPADLAFDAPQPLAQLILRGAVPMCGVLGHAQRVPVPRWGIDQGAATALRGSMRIFAWRSGSPSAVNAASTPSSPTSPVMSARGSTT